MKVTSVAEIKVFTKVSFFSFSFFFLYLFLSPFTIIVLALTTIVFDAVQPPRAASLEDQEYFGEILIGIKQVIHNHLKEMQSKFYEKFIDLEDEVRHRDDVIQQLQNRIHDLETGTVTVYGGGRGGGVIKDGEGGGKDRPGSSGSTGSSNELPFMVSTSNFLSTFYCDSCICNLFFAYPPPAYC